MKLSRNSATALLLALTAACHSTSSVKLNVNPDPSTRPSKVRIETRSGPRFTVYGPEVRNDSLFGWFDSDRTRPAAIPLRDISSAETRQFSGGRTAALVFGVFIATLAFLFLAALTTVEVID